MIKSFVFASLLILFSTFAKAVVYGGSNFGYGGYPDADTIRPTPPYDNDQLSMQMYKSQVDAYIQSVKDYLENADNDLKRIAEKQQETIDEANAVVEEYNRKAKGY